MAAKRRGIFQLDFSHRQSDEKMEDFGQGRDDVICGWMKRRSQSNPRTRGNSSANLLIDRRKN